MLGRWQFMKTLILSFMSILLISCSLVSASSNSQAGGKLLTYMDIEEVFEEPNALALAKSASKGNVKEIEKLIAKGVDVNARGKINGTPLFFALQSKQGFSTLIKHGADPNIIFDDGGTVLHWAAQMKDCDFLDIAIQGGGNPDLKAGYAKASPIFKTINIESGISNCFKVLIKNGCDINFTDSYGISVILTAASFARYDMVLELLKAGANYHKTDNYGNDIFKVIKKHEHSFKKGSKSEVYKEKVLVWLKDNIKT